MKRASTWHLWALAAAMSTSVMATTACEFNASGCICSDGLVCCEGQCVDEGTCDGSPAEPDTNEPDASVLPADDEVIVVDAEPAPAAPPATPAPYTSCLQDLRVVVTPTFGADVFVMKLGPTGFVRVDPDGRAPPGQTTGTQVIVKDGVVGLSHYGRISGLSSSTLQPVQLRPGEEELDGSGDQFSKDVIAKVGDWWVHGGDELSFFHPSDPSRDASSDFLSTQFRRHVVPFVVDGVDSAALSTRSGIILVQDNDDAPPTYTILEDAERLGESFSDDGRGVAYDDVTQSLVVASEGGFAVLRRMSGFSVRDDSFSALPAHLPANGEVNAVAAGDGHAYVFANVDADDNLLKIDLSTTPPQVVAQGSWSTPFATWDDAQQAAYACGHVVLLGNDQAVLRLFNSDTLEQVVGAPVVADRPGSMFVTTRQDLQLEGDE